MLFPYELRFKNLASNTVSHLFENNYLDLIWGAGNVIENNRETLNVF